jgi:mannose-6-phosphate isomerase-like protein (cupin superfamily)
MTHTVRRVVTGHDAQGHSIFLMDGTPPTVEAGRFGLRVTELWETTSAPANNLGDADPTLHPRRLSPPPRGTIFRIVEYQPDSIRRQHDQGAQFAAMQAPEARDPHGRHFGMHRTHTVDYAIVLSGEIFAMMEEGEVLLKQGDVLIQRGTNHAWSNRSAAPASIAFILVDAEPVPTEPIAAGSIAAGEIS